MTEEQKAVCCGLDDAAMAKPDPRFNMDRLTMLDWRKARDLMTVREYCIDQIYYFEQKKEATEEALLELLMAYGRIRGLIFFGLVVAKVYSQKLHKWLLSYERAILIDVSGKEKKG